MHARKENWIEGWLEGDGRNDARSRPPESSNQVGCTNAEKHRWWHRQLATTDAVMVEVGVLLPLWLLPASDGELPLLPLLLLMASCDGLLLLPTAFGDELLLLMPLLLRPLLLRPASCDALLAALIGMGQATDVRICWCSSCTLDGYKWLLPASGGELLLLLLVASCGELLLLPTDFGDEMLLLMLHPASGGELLAASIGMGRVQN